MSEPEPSLPSDWVTLTHDGQAVAEAWFMPDGDGFTGVFLVPRERLADDQPLTVEMLLAAVPVSADRVESWRLGDGAELDRGQPLPPPPADESHLTVHVRLRPMLVPDIPPEKWQSLDVLWKTILSLEAGIDGVRLGMDGLRAEMDNAFKRSMGVEEKVNALQADVAQWNKAKTRVHHALPKLREYVHRATWALAVPERKRLEEVVKQHIQPRVPFPDVDRVREQMEHLQKDRQVLLSQGNTVQQECRGILSEVQRAFGSLQRNAADRARQKRNAGQKGKF